jgi:hypothetical protein
MDRLIGAIIAPPGEVVIHRAAGRQVVRQVIPLAAGPALVQDRVDDLPHRIPALMAADRGCAAFHAVITGSISTHRSSDKSLGYRLRSLTLPSQHGPGRPRGITLKIQANTHGKPGIS